MSTTTHEDSKALTKAILDAYRKAGPGEPDPLDIARNLLASDWLALVRAESWDQGANAGGLMEHRVEPIPNPYRDPTEDEVACLRGDGDPNPYIDGFHA